MRMQLSRRVALHATALLLVPPPLLPRPAVAADLEVQLTLASLLAVRGAVADADGFLFAELLSEPERLEKAGGVAVKEGKAARKMVVALLKQGQLKELGREAARLGRRNRQLDVFASASSRRGCTGDEVANHAREAEERLAAILDFDATNSYKRDALGNVAQLMRPEELSFYHRAFVSAREEIERACACFSAEELRGAAAIVAKTGSTPLGLSTSLASDTRPTPPSMTASVVSYLERDAAIASAIGRLPSSVGTALTPSDLQRRLDNEVRESNAKQKGVPESYR